GRSAVDQFHDQVDNALLLVDICDGDQVLGPNHCSNLCFTIEACYRFGPFSKERRRKHLYGHLLLHSWIISQINRAHSALADLLQHENLSQRWYDMLAKSLSWRQGQNVISRKICDLVVQSPRKFDPGIGRGTHFYCRTENG